jgi:hypothetical protein
VHARTAPRSAVRSLALALGVTAGVLGGFGSSTTATAAGTLLADTTKLGNDGHPYHWQAPC